jgi:hypothetical protein
LAELTCGSDEADNGGNGDGHGDPIDQKSRDEPGASAIQARMRAALAGLDEGTFTEGYELDRKTSKQVPKAMIGRRLSQEEAKRLLAKFD